MEPVTILKVSPRNETIESSLVDCNQHLKSSIRSGIAAIGFEYTFLYRMKLSCCKGLIFAISCLLSITTVFFFFWFSFQSYYQRVSVFYVRVQVPIETMGQNTSSAEKPGTDALVLTPNMSPKS